MAKTQPLTKEKLKQCIKREDQWCEFEQKNWVETAKPYVVSLKEKNPTPEKTVIRSFEHYKTGNYLSYLLSEIKKQEKEKKKKEKQTAPPPKQTPKSSSKKPTKQSGPQVFYVNKKPQPPLVTTR